MNSFAAWNFIFSLSVAFPAVAGLIRLRKIEPSYYPFLIYIFVSLLSELLQGLLFIPNNKKTEILSFNLFNLFEAVILLVQFYYWKSFDGYKKIFPALLIVVVCGWLFENFIVQSVYHFNVIFLVCYSLMLVLLSVQAINHIIVNESTQPLITNAMFIICAAMIILFMYNIFIYTLLAKGIAVNNKKLMVQVFAIRVYVNALSNLLYGIGVCFISKKINTKDLFRDLQN